jgi:hypothetical protein
MARTVREIMNPELFSLRPSDTAEEAVEYVLALGITGAPVLDEQRMPLGVVSLRDLLRKSDKQSVAERMTVPAIVVGENERIESAARTLSRHGVHRVVVVDAEGRAVGVASSVDFVRALLGLPSTHPDSFPHWDKQLGVSWTDDQLLELEGVDSAPDGPGVLVLVSGKSGVPERVVWSESATNVRTRLYELLARNPDEAPDVARIFRAYPELRFRATALRSPTEQERVVEAMLARSREGLMPACVE